MSESTPRFGALFERLIGATFAADEVAVVNGGREVARCFAAQPFDHLVFTGATATGREVMHAAAANLTPLTLELGGKSPVIIADDYPLERLAKTLAFGKLVNAGQTCVAPDYVLLPRGREHELVALMKAAVTTFYPRLQGNPGYTSVINGHHVERINQLVVDARAQGAIIHPLHPERPVAGSHQLIPQVLTGVTDAMQIMQAEIFGPLLPVVPYDRFEDALDYVNRRPRPLAIYLFSNDRQRIDCTVYGTTSGGVVVNDVMIHVVQTAVPFGGVGPSGMGHYHGQEGFNAFSKLKAVVQQRRFNGMSLLHPPRGNGRLRKIIEFLIRR